MSLTRLLVAFLLAFQHLLYVAKAWSSANYQSRQQSFLLVWPMGFADASRLLTLLFLSFKSRRH